MAFSVFDSTVEPGYKRIEGTTPFFSYIQDSLYVLCSRVYCSIHERSLPNHAVIFLQNITMLFSLGNKHTRVPAIKKIA
jgi:hypothetical protein